MHKNAAGASGRLAPAEMPGILILLMQQVRIALIALFHRGEDVVVIGHQLAQPGDDQLPGFAWFGVATERLLRVNQRIVHLEFVAATAGRD